MEPARALADEYSRKAAAYARHWAPVIRPMALPVLDALPLATAGIVLDVGTGTGSLVPDLRAAAPDALVVGIDRAHGMLREAARRSSCCVAAMDAQQLGIAAEAVDVTIAAFVLFHIPNPSHALAEVHRVLRSGGVAGIVTWGADPGLPGGPIWAEELNREGAAPDARDPSVMQQARMDTPAKLSSLLAEAGLEPRRVWGVTFCHDWTPEDLFASQIGCGMPARRLTSLAPEARVRCASRVRARLDALPPEQLAYRPEVLYAIAQRPPTPAV